MAKQTFADKIRAAAEARAQADVILSRENIVAALAEVIPAGHAVVIEGTTPAFNDGDPCTFSLDSMALVSLKHEDGEDRDLNDDHDEYFSMTLDDEDDKPDGVDSEAWAKLVQVTDDIYDDEVMERVFGSNFRVAICADGTVFEYEHDCGY